MVRRKAAASSAPLINLLKSWSIQHKFQDDTYVSGLLEALETEENLEVWASLDPLDYLPTPSDKSNDIFLRFNLGLTIVRNALVFLPVALTWYAISKASAAFAVYTANNTLTVSNFLDFWENGYGVLAEEWSLSHIATLDFQIIMVMPLIRASRHKIITLRRCFIHGELAAHAALVGEQIGQGYAPDLFRHRICQQLVEPGFRTRA